MQMKEFINKFESIQSGKVLQVLHITESILEEQLQCLNRLFSGMVHLVDSILSNSILL